MPDAGGPHDFIHMHTDIPEGMTIREWHARRAAEHTVARMAAREDRRRQSITRRAANRLLSVRVRMPRPTFRGREIQA